MRIKILEEAGFNHAILGLSLSYNKEDMSAVEDRSRQLYRLNEGHNKFLESIVVWLDITAPRDFWQEMDTYRTGVTKQSESTMHTLLSRDLTLDDFQDGQLLKDFLFPYIHHMNSIKSMDISKPEKRKRIKKLLPEGFLQRRILTTNYKTLRSMISQRHHHGLDEWRFFAAVMCKALRQRDYLHDLMGKGADEYTDFVKDRHGAFVLNRAPQW